MEIEEINRNELIEYFGYRGRFGGMRLNYRLLRTWFLKYLATRSPIPSFTVQMERARGVRIGNHVYIGTNVEIDTVYPDLITIEDYVSIGGGCYIFAHSNPTYSKYVKEHYYPRQVAPVVIKRGVWIAPACIIMKGVTIGENSVVGCGSIVTRDVMPYTVVGGVPAKELKRLKPPVRRSEDTNTSIAKNG